MSRTKGAKNIAPTLDATIFVRCRRELKRELAKRLKGMSESQKVVTILTEYLAKK